VRLAGTSSVRFVTRWRHARAIVVLPGTVTILVPTVLLATEGPRVGWGLEGVAGALLVLLGLVLIPMSPTHGPRLSLGPEALHQKN
jgi:hypothetical protein